MAKQGIAQIIPIFLSVILGISSFIGCGTPGQLVGGPRDSIAPKVIKMTPPDFTTNFKGDKIEIQFDEYFKIQNEAKEFSVSPEFERQPTLKVKKKVLEISFQDTLEKNTTYTLNFGKSISDINEGNYIKNFTYVFSTGPELDSLSISGQVTNALTGAPEIEAVVMIFPVARDTLWGNKKASIYTTTDSSGNYQLKNLRAGTYKIYALQEKNSDKIYQQPTDEVAFLKDTIDLEGDRKNVNLKIFKEDATVFRVTDRKLNADGSIFIAVNQKLKKPSIRIIEPPGLDENKLVKFNATNDSLKLWLKDLSFDSTKVAIYDEGKALDTIKFTRGKRETYTRNLNANDNLEGNLLNPNKALKLTFNFPIEQVDPSKIVLTEDSVVKSGLIVEKDTSDFLSYLVRYPWIAKRTYELKFGAGAFTAIFNTKNKEFIRSFELANKDNYGTLQLKVLITDPKNQYILQVIDENDGVISSSTFQKDTTLVFNNYRAGKYFVRVIYDTNNNGKWDTGSVAEGRQPEKVYNEPKELSIKANWDRNETITIPKEPAT
ncbi:Ig-like domain-containing protein [Pedobacter sp.]|uniref:Ig-like domain-containing protein n=1 Tax=Pedobacter sp. TaxID=1411316 RepID=UPI003D7F714E